MQLDAELRVEVTPKNILMIGPTGVGKTEIARRLAKLANAPFIKIEATKFTEVGYVGRDVETIIRDLMDTAITMLREQEMEKSASAQKTPRKNAFWMPCCHRPARQASTSRQKSRTAPPVSCSASNCVKASWTTKKSKLN